MMHKPDSKIDPLFPFLIKKEAGIYGDISQYQSMYRMFYIQEGTLTGIYGKTRFTFGETNIIFARPGVGFSLYSGSSLKMINLAAGKSFIEQIIIKMLSDRICAYFNMDDDSGPNDDLIHIKPAPDLAKNVEVILAALYRELLYKKAGYKNMIISKFIELLIILYRVENEQECGSTNESVLWHIHDVIEHINSNYSHEYTLKEIAHKCGLNTTYFSRNFKKATGVALFEYINKVRIQKACLLLKKSQLSIIDIAYSVGYNNISFFNRCFRKFMKTSPRQYKNSINK